jgi:hypothetical protein
VRRLIFRGQHDGQTLHGLARVARVFAALDHGGVVIVNFPEDALAVIFKRSKVAFPMRIIVRGTFRATGSPLICLMAVRWSMRSAHESSRTTKLYDRTSDEITLDEIEQIGI